MDDPSPPRTAHLTVAKALPRKRHVVDDSISDEPGNAPPPTRDERITSWIRDASPISPAEASFLLPLTPPDDILSGQPALEEQGSRKQLATMKRTYYLDPSQQVSGSVIPVVNSPPTPELTPPKKTRERKRSPSPPLRRRKRTSLTPPPTSRQTSSKAESFRTALEQLSSPHLPPIQGPVTTFLSSSSLSDAVPNRPTPAGNHGLGIASTYADGERTPTRSQPTTLRQTSPLTEQLDEPVDASLESVESDPMVAQEPSAVAELSHADQLWQPGLDSDALQGFSYVRGDDILSDQYSAEERRYLQNGLAESELDSARSVSPLSEHLEHLDHIDAFADDVDDDDLVRQAALDSKRISQISNFSMPAAVEVMVIESVPKQQQKLRHASKNSSLRAAISSSQGTSNRSSLQSSVDYKPRISNMLGRLPNRTADSSLHSDCGISMVGSDHIMKRWSKLAATDIPRRQPSATQSLQYNYSPQYSSPIAPKTTSRPATAPGAADGSPGLRSMRQRTISNTSSSSKDAGPRRGRLVSSISSTGPPAIPTRTSSLGASTNREPAGSKFAASQISARHPAAGHSRAVSQPIPTTNADVIRPSVLDGHANRVSHQSTTSSQPRTPIITLSSVRNTAPTSPRRPLLIRGASDRGSGGWSEASRQGPKEEAALLASRALLKTPFSGHSVQSAFSGTYEVHEATAINFYPHTNSSLHVVQQATHDAENSAAQAGVHPGPYRIAEISSSGFSERARQPESVHVKIEGANGSQDSKPEAFADSPTLPYISVSTSRRSVHRAPSSEAETLPSVKLIPPTPLDMPVLGEGHDANDKIAIINGPMSLVRRALSSSIGKSSSAAPRTSGLWLSSRRKNSQGVVKRKSGRPTVKDDNLSPFWRPKKFWDDDDDDDDIEQVGAAVHTGESTNGHKVGSNGSTTAAGRGTVDDYFSQPVHNSLGFPQSRVVIPGPANLVRRLSSIRRYRNIMRRKFPASTQPPRLLSPSSLKAGPISSKPSSLKRPSSLAGESSTKSRSPVRIMSPTPSVMARRRASQKRSVRFEFDPMRVMEGSSGETPGWATRAMRKRSEKRARAKAEREEAKAEQRRDKIRGTIGQPKLETVVE